MNTIVKLLNEIKNTGKVTKFQEIFVILHTNE